jgi:CheY-like chemotaxis protein
MDLRMSDLNGFEATRRLGADEATAAIPVIAVSASAWGEVRQGARDAGCVDFLPKPVKADVLFAKLQRYTGVRFVSPAGEADAALEPVGPLNNQEGRDLAARIREAATIGSVADLDAIADQLSTAGAPGTLGRRIAALTAAFDYDALLRLAASLDQQP